MSRPRVHQLFEPATCTYTYLVVDPTATEGALIDPVLETAERDLALIRELGVKLKYVLETHVHADHVTGADRIRAATGAKVGVAKAAGVSCADLALEDGRKLELGALFLTVLATPGHTDGCVSYLADGCAFTGDALMIRTAGRTDFQQGSPEKLYRSITQRLFKLPPETVVYPGHDYKGFTSSTIGEEIRFNARAGGGKTESEFVTIMNGLNLPPPKRLSEAVPANLRCGRIEAPST